MAEPVPDGMTAVTPYLTVHGVEKLIEFLQKSFGATLDHRMDAGGKVMHAQVRINGAAVMMGEASAEWTPRPSQIYLYVPDIDELYQRAMANGGKSLREPTNEFYGDRVGGVEDPSGNIWWIATHVEDVPEAEMMERMKAARGH